MTATGRIHRREEGERLAIWLRRWFLLTLVVWGAGVAGLWDEISLGLHDRMVRISSGLASPPMTVLLMEGDSGDFSAQSGQWLALLEKLDTLGAAQTLLLEPPRWADEAFFRQALEKGRVLLGRPLLLPTAGGDLPRLMALPPAGEAMPFGLLHPGISRQGMHRHQFRFVATAGGTLQPTVEQAAFSAITGTTATPMAGSAFLIDFTPGYDSLPRIKLKEALAGNLVRELVEGRAVIIARNDRQLEAGMATPIASGPTTLTPGEFHAFGLHTLLSGRLAWERGSPFTLGVVILAALLALLAYHRLPDQWALAIALGGAAAYLLLAWGLLLVLQFNFPATEAALTHLLGFSVMLARRRRYVRERIIRILRRIAGRLQEGIAPPGFHESDEHWSQIANLVSQMLDMQQVMLLERIPGDHRLREVKSLNCSLDDIVEKRRDYERTPYSTAIQQNAPLRLERPYLTPRQGEGEIQYLTPLLFGGEVMGFWAFSLDSRETQNLPALEKAVALFGGQVAEMLHHRRTWRQQNTLANQGFFSWFGQEGGDTALVNEVNKSAILLEERLTGMEEVFHGQETGTILYNLFGNLLHVNRRMSQLAEALRLSPFHMTAADLIRALTRMEMREAREILRRVTLEQDSFFLPLTLPDQGNAAYVLQVRPLLGRESGENRDLPEFSFPVKGVLLELTDVSQIRRFQELKELLVDKVFNQLRNDLASVLMACDLLTLQDLPDSQREEITALLKTKTGQTVATMDKAGATLSGETDGKGAELFPVSCVDALNQAARNLEREQSERRVGLELNLPRLVSLVMAVPNGLTTVLESILAVLLRDAAEQSKVMIKVEERECRVTLSFANTGFGIPQERFSAYMTGRTEPTSEEFRNLRRALGQVRSWGGVAEAQSATGEGIRVTITLEVFLCQI